MGFVLLQSCDGCQSHDDIIGIGQQVLLEANKALEALQPGPSLPPNAAEYAGYYQGTPTVSTTAFHIQRSKDSSFQMCIIDDRLPGYIHCHDTIWSSVIL